MSTLAPRNARRVAPALLVALLAGCGGERERPSERTGGEELLFSDAVPVAFLILDKSSSMENTLDENGTVLAHGSDPENFQADAAKEFVHLASFLASDPERDLYPRVGVIAFSSRAELLAVSGAERGLMALREPGATGKVAEAIGQIKRDGWHTDINAALALALERFDELERTSGKAVRPLALLLTDGGLWPFPCDPDNYGERAERSAIEGYKDAYKKAHNKEPLPSPAEAGIPYNDEADAIEKKFVRPLCGYARMRLLDQVAPEFRKRGIPLCCVPLGKSARELLASVCEAGNRESTENRFLAVDDPADLPDRFTDVITSWLGIARHIGTGSFHVDETVGAVSFIVRFRPRLKSADAAKQLVTLTAPGNIVVGPDTTAEGMAVSVRHSAKSVLYFVSNPKPGEWTVTVRKDPKLAPPDLQVRYEYLFKSKVRMMVSGIRPSYSLDTPKLDIGVSFADVARAKKAGSIERLSLPATFAELHLTGSIRQSDGAQVAELTFEPLDQLADKAAMKGTAPTGSLKPGAYRLTVRATGRFKPSGPFKSGGQLTVRTRSYKILIEEAIVIEYEADGDVRNRVPFGRARKRSRVGD